MYVEPHLAKLQRPDGAGECFTGGGAAARDVAEAQRWLRLAKTQGDEYAELMLQGLEVALEVAVDEACRRAGECHERGDSVEAERWWRWAAEQGTAAAQHNLGVLLGRGAEGVAQDMAQAAAWSRRAAEQGDVEAQVRLAGCYIQGDGVACDMKEAQRLLELAAAQGHALGKGKQIFQTQKQKSVFLYETYPATRGASYSARADRGDTQPPRVHCVPARISA